MTHDQNVNSFPSPLSAEESIASRRRFLQFGVIAGSTLLLAGCESLRESGAPSGPPLDPRARTRTLPRPDDPDASGSSATSPASSPAAPPEPPLDLTPPRSEPNVRVRLARRTLSDAPVEVAAEGGGKQWIRVARPDTPTSSAQAGLVPPGDAGAVLLVLLSPVRVSFDGASWSLLDGAGQRSKVEGRGAIELGAVKGQTPRIRLEGEAYPGSIRFVLRGAEADDSSRAVAGVDLVNVVAMEEYLPGVLARELYATWRPNTFAAQAVAARSFACVESVYWRNRRHFDVVAGQASQGYVGSTDHAASLRAVRETRGALLTYGGRMVPGYYSSCCGGVSADARDAISNSPINDVAPLRARPPRDCCDWAPQFRWSSAQSGTEAAQRVMAWGSERPNWGVPALGPLTTIEPVQLNAYGRPVRYRLADARGASVELPAEHVRAALNTATATLPALRNPLRSGHFTSPLRSGSFQFAGRGYGHGAGLCQYGAEGMARKGVKWDAILDEYYPQAELARFT